MGWTSTHRNKGTSNLEWFRSNFDLHGENGRPLLLDMATAAGTAYGAMQLPGGDVRALVVLTQWCPNSHYNFRYKAMGEADGPVESACPARILNLLTPIDDEYATAWRLRCQAHLDARARARVVKKGATVRFARPIQFSDRTAGDTFVFQGGDRFEGLGPYARRFRIRQWRLRQFEIVQEHLPRAG